MSIIGINFDIEITKFPAGESLVKVSNFKTNTNLTYDILFLFESNSELFDLALVVDAVHQYCGIDIKLNLCMPYIPYARQDRVCNEGESLSIKVLANYINSLGFDKVFMKDPHSDVSAALINNVVIKDLSFCVKEIYLNDDIKHHKMILVAPDAGAFKKVYKLSQDIKNGFMITASKIRSVSTGEIVGTDCGISEEIGKALTGRNFLIVDDICDGGRTFIELAKAIKSKVPDAKVYLYVTHLLATKGYEVFDNLIDGIYTSNLMGKNHRLVLKHY